MGGKGGWEERVGGQKRLKAIPQQVCDWRTKSICCYGPYRTLVTLTLGSMFCVCLTITTSLFSSLIILVSLKKKPKIFVLLTPPLF